MGDLGRMGRMGGMGGMGAIFNTIFKDDIIYRC